MTLRKYGKYLLYSYIIALIQFQMKVPKVDYAKIAKTYDRLRTPSEEAISYWVKVIINFAKVNKYSRVLDVGCGTGRYTIPLAQTTGAIIYGLDPSTEMLEKAKIKDKLNLVTWLGGKAETLPFPKNFFDCVFMSFTIHHVTDRKRAIDEANRVLIPKGRLVIMTTSHNQFRRSPLHDFPKIRQIDLKRFPSLPALRKLMIQSRFGKVFSHSVTRMQKFLPVARYLQLAKEKPFSTFALISERDFETGLKAFEKRLKKKYGNKVLHSNEYAFVVGEKD